MHNSSARSFSRLFIGVALAWVLALASLTIWQQKVTGDLARIGYWSERAFGYHSTSPSFDTLANQPQSKADVAVLGDSFSRGNIWQSMLARSTGQTFQSWRMVETESCINNWVQKTVATHPTIRIVVIETIERHEIFWAAEHFDCTPDRSVFSLSGAGQVPMQRSYWPPTMDFAYLSRTSINGARERIWPDREFRSSVVNVPLRRADLFTNERSDRLLYFTDDELPWRASAEKYALAVKNLSELNLSLHQQGITLVVVIVPDKSNVYRNEMLKSSLPPAKTDLAALLRQAGVLSPDLLSKFRQRALSTQDFYLPDDTHLSLPGFEYLGATLTTYWKDTIAAPAS